MTQSIEPSGKANSTDCPACIPSLGQVVTPTRPVVVAEIETQTVQLPPKMMVLELLPRLSSLSPPLRFCCWLFSSFNEGDKRLLMSRMLLEMAYWITIPTKRLLQTERDSSTTMTRSVAVLSMVWTTTTTTILHSVSLMLQWTFMYVSHHSAKHVNIGINTMESPLSRRGRQVHRSDCRQILQENTLQATQSRYKKRVSYLLGIYVV
mmetsp:Transcript_21275/g.38652  ORF Transcript_21275/g.38652 Transcript_21275/m.38652 type:complete len:207 (-) Transcript_21275:138-758(-)